MRSCLILCILAGLESFGNIPHCCGEEEGAMLFRSASFISIIFAAALAPKINADADSPSGRAFGNSVKDELLTNSRSSGVRQSGVAASSNPVNSVVAAARFRSSGQRSTCLNTFAAQSAATQEYAMTGGWCPFGCI